MAKRRLQRGRQMSQKEPQQGVRAVAKQVDLNLIGAKDHPLLTASNLVVNFIGTDFLVTVVDAYPEPYTGPSRPLTDKEDARVRKLCLIAEISLPTTEQ
jgi:hypothetical protein